MREEDEDQFEFDFDDPVEEYEELDADYLLVESAIYEREMLHFEMENRHGSLEDWRIQEEFDELDHDAHVHDYHVDDFVKNNGYF